MMNKFQKKSENEEHPWRVGDLCSAVFYNRTCEGIIYRVIEVNEQKLKITPTFGVIASIENRKTRSVYRRWCQPLSIVDLASEYVRFGTFIFEEASKHGIVEEASAEKVCTRNTGYDT